MSGNKYPSLKERWQLMLLFIGLRDASYLILRLWDFETRCKIEAPRVCLVHVKIKSLVEIRTM